jgi:hypothetical protein
MPSLRCVAAAVTAGAARAGAGVIANAASIIPGSAALPIIVIPHVVRRR